MIPFGLISVHLRKVSDRFIKRWLAPQVGRQLYAITRAGTRGARRFSVTITTSESMPTANLQGFVSFRWVRSCQNY